MQASAEKRDSESTNSRSAAAVLALPVELQLQILSHLSIEDQISAVKISPIWKDIIMNEESMKKSRYGGSALSYFCAHHIVTWSGTHAYDGIIQDPKVPVFSFMVQDGTLTSFLCTKEGPGSEAGRQKRTTSTVIPPGDISELIFLDEPILAPFEKVPGSFTFHDGEKPKSLLTRKRQQANGVENVGGVVYPRYHSYYYDTEDTTEEAKAEVGSSYPKLSAHLNVMCPSWSGDLWTAILNLRRGTTIREVVEAIARETEPILKKWGIRTELPHEIFFASFDLRGREWCLMAGVVANPEDSDYYY